jgi:hypothetical protein
MAGTNLNNLDRIQLVKAPNGTFWYVNGNGAWQQFTLGGGDCCNGTITAEGNITIESTGGSVGVDAADEINAEAQNNAYYGSVNGTITVQSRGNATMQSLNGNLLLNSPNGNVLVNGVKVYKALLTQTGTNAPVATVLQNSLGVTPTYGYTDIGIYTITATSTLTLNKTAVSFGSNISINDVDAAFIQSNNLSVNGFTFVTFDVSSAAFNGVLNNTLITIEVYP